MLLKKFIDKAGFKILSMAQLSSCEYSIVFYLLNCLASGLKQIIITDHELATNIRIPGADSIKALEQLVEKNIVKIKFNEKRLATANSTLSLSMQLDFENWQLDTHDLSSTEDAIVYPFNRKGSDNLTIIPDESDSQQKKFDKEKILACFLSFHELTPEKQEESEKVAAILCDTYPTENILLILQHFGARIKSLSFLASSWEHFNELYTKESRKVDFIEAKKHHEKEDEKLRSSASSWLSHKEDYNLTKEEAAILEVIINHKKPRRQLYWAYQLKHKYKNLKDFFNEHLNSMTPITTSGTIVKKPPTKDD